MRTIYCLCVTLILSQCVIAQTQDIYNYPKVSPVIPPSPDAASLGKYGDIPVSEYTGMPNINIPVYEIKYGMVNIPVTLNYHSSGIKVEEMASWVGLGWSLNAGGVITRTIKGLPDESVNGYLNNNVTQTTIQTAITNNTFDADIWRPLKNRALDLEPDEYYFNFLGISGRFYIDRVTKNPVIVPHNNMSITYQVNPAGIGNIEKWIVKTTDGFTYAFGKTIDNSRSAIEKIQSIDYTTTSSSVRHTSTVISSWFLMEIQTPQGEFVNFRYTPYTSNYCNRTSETEYHATNVIYSRDRESAISLATVNGYNLDRIDGRFGRIEFETSSVERKDLKGCYPLSTIEVYNADNIRVKHVLLNYSYYESNATNLSPVVSTFYNDNRVFRLKLDRVAFVSDVPGSSQVYRFSYNYDPGAGKILPERLSFSQDYWGFYNGRNNLSGIPRYPWPIGTCDAQNLVGSADRMPVASKMMYGILNRIEYPTGGYTDFEFEPHDRFGPLYFNFEYPMPGDPEFYENYARLNTMDHFIDPIEWGNPMRWTFTVNSEMTAFPCNTFLIRVVNPNNCNWDDKGSTGCGVNVFLWNLTTNQRTELYPGDIVRNLTNGSYRLEIHILTPNNLNSRNIVATVMGPKRTASGGNKIIGGLRVKSIKSYDGLNTATPAHETFYTYRKKDQPTQSSGHLFSEPGFHYNIGLPVQDLISENYYVLTSNSNLPLSGSQGSNVGYQEITVDYGPGGINGRKELKFNMELVSNSLNYPFAPSLNFEHHNGLLLSSIEYANKPATGVPINHVPVRKIVNEHNLTLFTNNPVNSSYSEGIKLGCGLERTANGGVFYCLQPIAIPFKVFTDWVYQKKSIETVYDESDINRFMVKETEYTPAPGHLQVTKVTAADSKQAMQTSESRYIQDLTFPASSTDPAVIALKSLKDKNIILPVEKYIYKELPGGVKVVMGGTITLYGTNALPAKIYYFETAAPIPFSSFVPCSIDGNGNFAMDPHYKEAVLFQGYDASGNLLQQKKASGETYSYIWGHQSMYPIAECANTSGLPVAYTSFEPDAKGNWTYGTGGINSGSGVTGNNSYNVSGTVSCQLVSEKDYIISYWSNSGAYSLSGGNISKTITGSATTGGWTYYEHQITTTSATVSLAGNGAIDELRAYPQGGMMKTFSYAPLVGMISAADANSQVYNYKYDVLGRLKLVTDKDGNVLKTYEYKYQQEQ